jgi:O-acetylserine/cysteine efflux transporter
MKTRDVLAAISVAIVWGLTFIAIKIGVGETTPLALSALRFVFAALPAVFFVRPPKASPWIVALYGLFIGVGQFGLLFVAIRQGFPVGLASLIIQLQAFFTIFLAWALMRERPRRAQLGGGGGAVRATGADRRRRGGIGRFRRALRPI